MANSSKFNSLIDIIVQSIQDVKGNNISLLDFEKSITESVITL